MPARITGLIDKLDGFQIVLDEIAAILVVESQAQQLFAATAGKDPGLWALRIYTERANPWHQFLGSPDNATVDATPIVSVSYDGSTFPPSGGNVVEQQRSASIFHIDCYGYAKSEETAEGHDPGDERAKREVHRALRLVRNILLAGPYIHLGLKGLVGRRWPQAVNVFTPSSENRAVDNVAGARLTLAVDHQEYSPQVQGTILESLSLEVTKSGSGQILLRAVYPIEDNP